MVHGRRSIAQVRGTVVRQTHQGAHRSSPRAHEREREREREVGRERKGENF